MNTCKSLYVQCLEYWIPKLENYWRAAGGAEGGCEWLENLAAPVVEDMLTHAFYLANHQNKSINKLWREEWKIFFTPQIVSAVIPWDPDLIGYVSARCQNLSRCRVVTAKSFDGDLIRKLPKSVTILDFDGELIDRGKTTRPLQFDGDATESWLPHAEGILRALQTLRTPPPDYPSSPNLSSLSEVHLGTIHASASDLKSVIACCPNLRLLRHYQMVTALYELHSDAWGKKQPLPKYKLRNLDVDFSHVVRCRMSPQWVLSPDALRLAVALCPSASSIRVRFDCSTPHDVLAPLASLSKVKEFSAVCVSSGERTLLDFGDVAPILDKFGPAGLSLLELKVIEEVELHVIVERCTKIETLILSGCGYVTPPTCSSFGCQRYERGALKRLRSLFYADGDDFGWDSGAPDCFWKAALCPSGKTRPVRLQGLFLEYPRMSAALVRDIFQREAPFPELRALSLCRFREITANEVAAVCGVSPKGEANPCRSLRYVRLSDCEKVDDAEEKRLRKWLRHAGIDLKLEVDRSLTRGKMAELSKAAPPPRESLEDPDEK